MSKHIYLYRAVTIREEQIRNEEEGYTDYLPERFPLGRMSGYLSRSSAVDAGDRSGVPYRIERSEPITFPTEAEKLRSEIQRLTAELAAVEAVAC